MYSVRVLKRNANLSRAVAAGKLSVVSNWNILPSGLLHNLSPGNVTISSPLALRAIIRQAVFASLSTGTQNKMDKRYLIIVGAVLVQAVTIGCVFGYGVFFTVLESEFCLLYTSDAADE